MGKTTAEDKKAYHYGDLRRALLDDAAQLLREEGESGLSMRKLAAKTGVSRTAPYHHFKDKQELLCGIAEEGFRRFRTVFNPPDLDDKHAVNEQRIQRLVKGYIDFATSQSEYYDLMFGSQLWKTGGLTEELTREAHGTFLSFLDGVRQWQKQDNIPDDIDALRYAQMTWSTMHGMSRLLIDGIYVDNQAISAMCNAAANMLWRELTAQESPNASR